MGIEKIVQSDHTIEEKRAKLVALEDEQGHNQYSELFDSIERDPAKVQAIIAKALMDKAVAEKAFAQSMGVANQNGEDMAVTKSVKDISDALLDKMRGK